MNPKKSNENPIWDFLADAIHIAESQARLAAEARPQSLIRIWSSYQRDTIQRLTQMLLLDARRTRTWLRDQNNSVQRCATLASLTANRAAEKMAKVRTILATSVPVSGLKPTLPEEPK